MFLHYLTHPEVNIDPDTPVPQWTLSKTGRARAILFSQRAFLKNTAIVISSNETKAIETAEIVSTAINIPLAINDKTHENDRSATGFLKPIEFEQVADAFFEKFDESIQGWETAADAQTRIVNAMRAIVDAHQSGDILMVGHGAVGTLLYCHLADVPISRAYDQPKGGGNMFAFNLDDGKITHPWKKIEDL